MADTFRTSAENVVELLSKYKLVNFKWYLLRNYSYEY
jgi:hypothetical protein